MKKVLIVDDATFMRLTIKNMLLKHGFDVVGEAENGRVAVEKYEQLRPDIVTMDITMPEVDGITALRRIMTIDPRAKVVMMTAMGQQEIVQDAIRSGARGFVVKPFKEETVINALAKA